MALLRDRRIGGFYQSPWPCAPIDQPAIRPRTAENSLAVQIEQGHYRIGSRHEPFAYDNELPPQAVQLSAFRIGLYPATNAEYLAFIEAGG